MPYDDDDDLSPPKGLQQDPAAQDGLADDGEDEEAPVQDFRLFQSALNKRQAVTSAIRRGEKDFESHGTRAQADVLEDSRNAMHDVLDYTRTHRPGQAIRAWYFPDRFKDAPLESALSAQNSDDKANDKSNKTTGIFARERVVIVEDAAGSPLFKSLGRVVTGLDKDTPGWGMTWLLPEEALFMVERGSLDLWWPFRRLDELFPAPQGEEPSEVNGTASNSEYADYDKGIPLSLQAAYSLLLGKLGERGKISLEKFQVYSNLRRLGYPVLRASQASPAPAQPRSLIQWLVSFVNPPGTKAPHRMSGNGPLVKPGLYRSYVPIFAQLALIPRYQPAAITSSSPSEIISPAEPFNIHFHVWKSNTNFTKARPPPPDFRMAVVDARTTSVPSLDEMGTLLEASEPGLEKKPEPRKPGQEANVGLMYKRLKNGWRSILVAVVDGGMISYLRLGEMAFGEEKLYDMTSSSAAKKGGRGKGGGRGGRGGGGRGRGRGRGRGG